MLIITIMTKKEGLIVIMKKLIFVLFLVLFLKEVIAIGIVTSYLEDNTLEVMEGTSTTYEILLQNTGEETETKEESA